MEVFKNRKDIDKTVKRLIKKGFVKENFIIGGWQLTPQGIEEMERRGLVIFNKEKNIYELNHKWKLLLK